MAKKSIKNSPHSTLKDALDALRLKFFLHPILEILDFKSDDIVAMFGLRQTKATIANAFFPMVSLLCSKPSLCSI